MNRYFHTLLVLTLSAALGMNSTANAQTTPEVEPNQPCSKAQSVGNTTLPFTQNGSLDYTNERFDVDFFRFTGTPGRLVTADLEGISTGKGTLDDPLLGFFDSGCNLIESNDDNGSGSNSRLLLTIPADGIFILSATSFPDFEFIGGGTGTYQMMIRPFTPNVKISGQLVDKLFEDPLRGDAEPFAHVELERCDNSGCYWINSQNTDSEGRFRFISDNSRLALSAGKYRVIAYANQYQSGRTGSIIVADGENRNIGHFPLQPFPIQFSDVLPCDNMPAEGGICRYSVKVTNHLSTPFYGKAWSVIWAYPINSYTSSTRFQVKAEPLKLKSHKGTNVQFEFQVPAGALIDDAIICATIYVGQSPNAHFNTVGNKELFCITKADSGFKIMPEKTTQKMFRSMNGKTAQRAAAKARVGMISR